VVPLNQVPSRAEAGRGRLKLAGCMVSIKERPLRNGGRMAWLTITDTAGSCEVTLFDKVLDKVRHLLVPGAPLLVSADVGIEGEALRITAQEVGSLERAAAEAGASMRIWLRNEDTVPHIRSILSRGEAGRGRIYLVPMMEGQEVEIALPGRYPVTPRLRQALKSIAGVERVEDA
jgi:DNA polymerase-3 subunit alpha